MTLTGKPTPSVAPADACGTSVNRVSRTGRRTVDLPVSPPLPSVRQRVSSLQMAQDIAQVFAGAVAVDPTRPLLTWYDDVTGERTELSGATLDNWVSKTANMLVDAATLGPGDRAVVLLPPHWQTAAVLLGCWSAGLDVESGPAPHPVDVQFAAATKLEEALAWPATDRYVLTLAPMAAPLPGIPPGGFADYVMEVRAHGDRFTPYALGGRQSTELAQRAVPRAAELGIGAGDRVLIDAARHADPLDWLLAPLAAGATIVLCGRLDKAKLPGRVASEKITVTLTA